MGDLFLFLLILVVFIPLSFDKLTSLNLVMIPNFHGVLACFLVLELLVDNMREFYSDLDNFDLVLDLLLILFI